MSRRVYDASVGIESILGPEVDAAELAFNRQPSPYDGGFNFIQNPMSAQYSWLDTGASGFRGEGQGRSNVTWGALTPTAAIDQAARSLGFGSGARSAIAFVGDIFDINDGLRRSFGFATQKLPLPVKTDIKQCTAIFADYGVTACAGIGVERESNFSINGLAAGAAVGISWV